jgi:hypothetical protein
MTQPAFLIQLDEPQQSALTIRYQPDGDASNENPPRFAWLPTLDETSAYVLEVSRSEQFADGTTRRFPDIQRTYFTPDCPLEPGTHTWRYAVWDRTEGKPASNWSGARSFSIPEGLSPSPLPSSAARLARGAKSHPRLWLDPAGLKAFSESVAGDPAHNHFDRFLEQSVTPFLTRDIHPEVAPDPGGKRTAPLWRQIYIDCQECLYAVRHLAIAGRVLGDEAMLDRAKDWLLALAHWDPAGTTSRVYNDEAAFRIAGALAWGYDWLHDRLSDDERRIVRAALVVRCRDLHMHIFQMARIHIFPYDSHAIRFLSAALIPCAIALLHDEPEAQVWLDDTVEFLFSIYPPWGGADGGWAEGPHYWTLGLAYLLDAAGLLKNYLGIDLLARPFFRATLDFALYTKAPGGRRVAFGDDSTMGDLPSLKLGYNVRRLALETGNGWGQWYFDRLKRDDPGTAKLFYNYGWWDFVFDDMVTAHDAGTLAPRIPTDLSALRVFHDVGWVAVQHHMHDPAKHWQLLFKSSPFGSLSHSHADQNAFLLRACGEDLAIQSGHYVAFNSAMHRNWRRQTVSKNAILIGGRGQYADEDKARSKAAAGRIVEAREDNGVIFMRGDATVAYRTLTPSVRSAVRDIHVVGDRYLVVIDRVDLDEALPLQWLLHSEHPITAGGTTFRFTGQRAGLYGQIVLSSAGAPALTAVEGFPGIDGEELAQLTKHWHVEAAIPSARRHTVATLLVPYRLDTPRRVLHYIDDQGYDTHLHFVEADGHEHTITIEKSLVVV